MSPKDNIARDRETGWESPLNHWMADDEAPPRQPNNSEDESNETKDADADVVNKGGADKNDDKKERSVADSKKNKGKGKKSGAKSDAKCDKCDPKIKNIAMSILVTVENEAEKAKNNNQKSKSKKGTKKVKRGTKSSATQSEPSFAHPEFSFVHHGLSFARPGFVHPFSAFPETLPIYKMSPGRRTLQKINFISVPEEPSPNGFSTGITYDLWCLQMHQDLDGPDAVPVVHPVDILKKKIRDLMKMMGVNPDVLQRPGPEHTLINDSDLVVDEEENQKFDDKSLDGLMQKLKDVLQKRSEEDEDSE